MEAVTTLLTVIQKIVKAAEIAQQNRARCLDLADRADAIGDSLRVDQDPTAGTGGGAASYSAGPQTVRLRMRPLGRLKAALDEALELVESCRRRESGLVARGIAVFAGESMATKLQDVDTRITACVGDLGLAEQIAARHRAHRHRAIAEAALAQEPPQQQWPPSLQRLLEKYTPPPVPPPPLPPVKQSKQPLPPSPQRFLKQSAPHPPPLPPVKQSTRPLPPSLQSFVKKKKQQQQNVMQPLPQATHLLQQRYLARSATPQQHHSFVPPPVPQPQQQRYSTTPSELLQQLCCAARDAAV